MELTLLGTGCPVPTQERAGSALTVTIEDETLLFDCGPRTVYRLMEDGTNPASIQTVFFSHHHMDHNASFLHFAMAGWIRGRRELELVGPPGTGRWVDALEDLYREDIEYKTDLGFPEEGIKDVTCTELEPGDRISGDHWTVASMEVEHSITTYAYRITDEESGSEIVYSGDTAWHPPLADFARGADALVQDCTIAPVGAVDPDLPFVWDDYTRDLEPDLRRNLQNNHTSVEEAARLASRATVDTLVLTHLLPYRDVAEIEAIAGDHFDGDVVVGRDNLALSI